MGGYLPFINVGTGLSVLQMDTSWIACAILDDFSVKCWGNSDEGELGKGNILALGDDPNEMGNYLTPIQLGTGLAAVYLILLDDSVCVVMQDESLKCWGRNSNG